MKLWPFCSLLFVLTMVVGVRVSGSAAEAKMRVYFGTYTTGKSKGIYSSEFDPISGKLGAPELAVETKSPSFLAVHPNRPVLYAVGEMSSIGGKKEGAVSAFSMDGQSGKLTLLNQQPSGGGGPCHVSLDRAGRFVLVANYGTGSIAALPEKFEGHSSCAEVQPHPSGKFVYGSNRGHDSIAVFAVDEKDARLSLVEHQSTQGKTPRHFAVDPTGKWLLAENQDSGNVVVF